MSDYVALPASPCNALRHARRVHRLERQWDRLLNVSANGACPCSLLDEIEVARSQLADATPSTIDGALAQILAARRDIAIGDEESLRRADQLTRQAAAFLSPSAGLIGNICDSLSLSE